MAEALVSLDQVNSDRKRPLFRVTDSVNFLGGLVSQTTGDGLQLPFARVAKS